MKKTPWFSGLMVALIGIAVLLIVWFSASSPNRSDGEQKGNAPLPTNNDSPDGAPEAPERPVPPPEDTPENTTTPETAPPEELIGGVLDGWRRAIRTKDSSGVTRLQRILLADPEPFRLPLIKLVEEEAHEPVRAFSVRILGIMGGEEVVPFLLDRLRLDRNRYVRENAARALGTLKASGAEAVLRKAAAEDPEAAVRAAAKDGLKAFE